MMKTDWKLIRDMMNAAIDTCERVEACGYKEDDRDATTEVGGQLVSVQDVFVSAWTYPETMRYRIIRDRHDSGTDLAYVPETARILIAMAQACGELIGTEVDQLPVGDELRKMIDWFETHAPSTIENAIAERRSGAQKTL